MLKKIVLFYKKIIRHVRKANVPTKLVKKIFKEKEYLEAYSQHTDLRVKADPHSAIGGHWEEIGQLQFDFVVNRGLHPHHKMLDIGCGTLRGGRHFIKYLNTGNYNGIDISQKAIEYAKQFVLKNGLSEKTPHLLVSWDKNLKFLEFSGEIFDYILAQSVFTHLKPEHIEECFDNISSIMQDNSVFYFTYRKEDEYRQKSFKDFRYPFSFFKNLANQYGFRLQDFSKEYFHKRGQNMIELRKK